MGTFRPRNAWSVWSMKPSPPNATMTDAFSGPASPYLARSLSSMLCASGASEATKCSWSGMGPSAAGQRHRAGDGGFVVTAVDDEIMTFGFAADGFVDDGIVGRCTQGRPQIGGIVLPQAHIEHPGAGKPHAVAAFAEIVAQRRDET